MPEVHTALSGVLEVAPRKGRPEERGAGGGGVQVASHLPLKLDALWGEGHTWHAGGSRNQTRGTSVAAPDPYLAASPGNSPVLLFTSPLAQSVLYSFILLNVRHFYFVKL